MNNIKEFNEIKIKDMIYEVRGKQVMLDSDLAKLYGTKTKRINEAVLRNKEKFPERYSFILDDIETNIFEVAICDLKDKNRGGRRYNPRVFTEQGVAMLATILKTSIATQTSIQIMDAFILMRKYISTNLLEQKHINNQVMKNTEDIKILQESFSKFESKRKVNEIYFNGQIYDAYSKILDILNETKQELIIIDGYADKSVLDLIKNLKVEVTLIVRTKTLLTQTDINKYNSQYNNLKIAYNDTFHDRYFIIDKKEIYHCGTSLNRIGNKTFSINVLEDEVVKCSLINKVNEII